MHDLGIFKENRTMFHEDIYILGDKAYKGIHKIYFMSLVPIKASKNNSLTDIDRYDRYHYHFH